AATGVEAITRAARYARVAFDYGVDWQVFEEDDVIRISFPTSPTTLAERIATEVGVAAFLHYFRTMGRQDVVPSDVVFSHAAPADTRAHKAFFRGPIRWGAGVPGFAFDAAYAERSVLPKADRSMNQFFERYADDLLEQMQRGTTARARVRAIVEVELANGDPSSGQVAKRLAMSERSLRRTLREEGTTFREVVDEVRHGRALSLLRAPQMSVAQVAYLLGFSDVSTFSRAFKRWTGTSPRAFRRSEVQ
ncbi:MAG: helix-turn-helix domain-containing protein, partial [Myxococcota bacterium]